MDLPPLQKQQHAIPLSELYLLTPTQAVLMVFLGNYMQQTLTVNAP
jgi:hypothetical protein